MNYDAPPSYEGCTCAIGSGVCDKSKCKACRSCGHLFSCPRSAPDRWINDIDPVVATAAARATAQLSMLDLVNELQGAA